MVILVAAVLITCKFLGEGGAEYNYTYNNS